MHRWLWLILLLLLPFSLHAEPAAKNANLWEALSGGNIAVAMDLVRAGANVNELHADGRPPLFEAMYQDRPALVSLMLEHGANANALSRPKTGAGAVAVAVTLRDDRPEGGQALLAHDASVDQPDEHGWTPLLLAAKGGRLADLRMLIEHGADLNATIEDKTLLDVAEDFEIAAAVRDDVLARYSEKLPAKVRGAHQLLSTVARGASKDVEAALAGLDLSAPVGYRGYRLGEVAMQEAARLGQLEIVQLLRRRSVPVTVTHRYYGDPDPITLAAAHSHWNVVRDLIEAGAPTFTDFIGYHGCFSCSLIEVALAAGQLDLARILRAHGDRLKSNVPASQPELDREILTRAPEILAFALESNEVKINREFDAGYDIGKTTLFWEAVKVAPLASIKLLLERGADLKRKTTWNLEVENRVWRRLLTTAADVAAREGRYEVLALLLDRGVKVLAEKRKDYTFLRAAFVGDAKAIKAGARKASAALLEQAVVAAAMGNQPESLRLLFAAGAPANAGRFELKLSSHPCTALMFAMKAANVAAAQALLESGAEVRGTRDAYGNSATTYAAQSPKRKELLALLMAHGMTANNDLAVEFTATCAAMGDLGCLEMATNAGLDLKASVKGNSALLGAAGANHPEVVRHLLKLTGKPIGAGFLVAAAEGFAYSDHVTTTDALETAKMLLAAGAAVDERTAEDESPLVILLGALRPHAQLFELLRQAGADRCPRNKRGFDLVAMRLASYPSRLGWIEQPDKPGWTCTSPARK